MSEKMTCPGCGAHTSSVRTAYVEGEPCPNCDLPAEATAQVLDARRRSADAELTERYTQAIMRAERAEQRVRRLETTLQTLRDVLDEAAKDVPR